MEVNGKTCRRRQNFRKRIRITDNMTTTDRVVLCTSEFCATAILLFLCCAGCAHFGTGPSFLQVSLTVGFSVMVAVQCFGHISGAHINPLVTVTAATLGNIPLIQVPVYFVGQMLGALGGFGLVKLVTPHEIYVNSSKTVGLCSPSLNVNVNPIQGLMVEFFLSLVIALICCAVWDSRNKTNTDSLPVRFGLSVAILTLVGAPYTGGNMNPARSFAPALINGDWDNHWVYWLAPLGAGFLGALFYRLIFGSDPTHEEEVNAAENIPLNDKA